MKNIIVYTATFVQAFVLITVAVVLLNMYFVDIFHFNFSLASKLPKKNPSALSSLDSAMIKQMKETMLDSIRALSGKDSLFLQTTKARKDSMVIDSLHRYIAQIIDSVKKAPTSKRKEAVKPNAAEALAAEANLPVKRDSAYHKWKKDTIALYEMMDAKKVAKIIQSFSDNIARDILYSMKKKKAAEILAQFTPEIANRITKAQ